MKSFGRLLRRLRGKMPLAPIAERAAVDPEDLAQVEAGHLLVNPAMARRILRHGFDLTHSDTERLLLGIRLYDLGLKDNEIRQLVIALIRKELPRTARADLKQLYRRYSAT